MTSDVELHREVPRTAVTHPFSVLVGNPRSASRTLDIACRIGRVLHGELLDGSVPLAAPGLVDLSTLGAQLATWDDTPPAATAATATVCSSRLLVVASPTLKASYSGLLKLFLDRLPRHALSGVVAVPVMTAASPAHAFAADACLRPVLVELGASVPVPGLTILESEFGGLGEVLRDWRASVSPVLSAVLTMVGDHD